ncbi:hypothetical protein K503DRAFT_152950 [Rhizopogon vinicolor AM-OR11-026]|uniref:Uncharacterized protein n=1 Tax=Rhizopogon vinicolor AM-OR11-026 TaxID=1314800 RepID=A0A1B7N0X6_9AGAM|nr:hypothetical protein K503DRAFT_152950 [Rhizopogon vinicolor AM-OR11-026]
MRPFITMSCPAFISCEAIVKSGVTTISIIIASISLYPAHDLFSSLKEIDRITRPRLGRARGLPATHTHHLGLVSPCYCSSYVSYVHIFRCGKKENISKNPTIEIAVRPLGTEVAADGG